MVVILKLKDFLKKNKNTRKIFGKKELEIILKQIQGISLTQSERNRLSRDIRPKFEFIKEANEFSKDFRLKKNQDNNKLIQNAVDVILGDELCNSIKAIFLFGSFADNSFTKRSDIDICAVFDFAISVREATQFRIRISGNLPKKLDIQVFNILPQKIKKDIARNHKVLYKNKDYDNLSFSINYLKDDDYFIRIENIFGAAA